MSRPKVYFLSKITESGVVFMFDTIAKELPSPVCCKIHSGEDGNQNFLRPPFFSQIVDRVKGVICECNTAYQGARNTTDKHWKLMEKHEWTKYYPNKVDLMDEYADVAQDLVLTIDDGFKIKKNYVGAHLKNYNSMLVLSHLKGHGMGGFGGALKQLSIGCASSNGKAYIHTAGVTTDPQQMWPKIAKQDDFLDSMSDAATSVVRHFNGNMVFINVMKNISIDCDCAAKAEDPCMKDIGILGSLDPVAVDQACIDQIINSSDVGKEKIIERINKLHGLRTIQRCEEHGIGRRDYELVTIG